MAQQSRGNLNAQFQALQRERERTWSAAAVADNALQRRLLTSRFDPASTIQVGGTLPAARLVDVGSGKPISLADAIGNSPTVLIFFRFATCAACNIALPYYDRVLGPKLGEQGVKLLAISPQVPDKLIEIVRSHRLQLTVLSDPDNGLARQLGLTFAPEDQPDPPPANWIGDVTGTGGWELPYPSVLLVDGQGQVLYLHCSPDWLDRPEAEEILAAVAVYAKHP